MSDNGNRVFFAMTDALAPGAVSGNQNIYEWEEGQVYLLATADKAAGSGSFSGLFGSSASGDDVFIHTPRSLDPRDVDSVQDIYDIRVGGGFPPPPPPPTPCDPAADQCQGAPASVPPMHTAASEGLVGPGNPVTKRTCGKGLIRRHGRCVPRRHHRRKHHRKKHHKRILKQRAADTRHGGAK
jgi:hypothetical protein